MFPSLAVLLVLASPPADGAPPPETSLGGFEWRAPSACPDAEGFATRLRARASARQLAQLHGQAEVRGHASTGFTASLEIVAADGTRDVGELRARDCALLADIVAVKVGLALAPVDDAPPPVEAAPPPVDPPSRAPVAESPARPPATSSAPPSLRRSIDVVVSSAGGVEFGVLPAIDARTQLGVGMQGPRWRAELLATYAAPRAYALPPARALVQLAGATLRGCLVAPIAAFEGAWCIGFDAGALVARGLALPSARRTTRPRLAAEAGAVLAWPREGRVRIVLGVDAMLALVRPALALDDERLVWRAPRVGLRTVLGAQFAVTKLRRRGHPRVAAPSRGRAPP